MSVTSMDANCGHVGIRSPHGCVRSTSRFIRCVPSSVRPILLSDLSDDLVRERQVDRVRERDRAVDLLETEEALHRALDALLRDAFVLRPGLAALEGLVRRLDDGAGGLRLPAPPVKAPRTKRWAVHRPAPADDRAEHA